MHLIATYLPVLIDYAFNTSEKVPSPFLLMSLYSIGSFIVSYICMIKFLRTMHILKRL